MLVHQAPRPLLSGPVVAAGLVEVQNRPAGHDGLGVLHCEGRPLNEQRRFPDEGFPVDPLQLPVADSILLVEGGEPVLGDLRIVFFFDQLHSLFDGVPGPQLQDVWVQKSLLDRL